MTCAPLPSQTPRIGLNTATISLILAIALQFAASVAWASRQETQQAELRATTEPLRRGDLVKIQTDVAWIRERLEERQP